MLELTISGSHLFPQPISRPGFTRAGPQSFPGSAVSLNPANSGVTSLRSPFEGKSVYFDIPSKAEPPTLRLVRPEFATVDDCRRWI